MARGWESKAVADQIEEANSRVSKQPRPSNSLLSRQREQKINSLRLSKARLLEQLERATHPAYRTMLQNGLQAIEAQIEEASENIGQ
ncbi:MAG: hypothetical protein ABR555_00195 [Pyrinomonadaceae bacterium]